MNLVYCEGCGAVFNGSVIYFPPQYDPDNEVFTTDNYYWDGDKYIPISRCPICQGEIREE